MITDTDRRGAQVFATQLQAGLAERGVKGRVVALHPGRRNNGLPVTCLGESLRSPRLIRALRAEIRKADVVVAHGSTTLPMCVLAGVRLDVPMIYRSIGDPAYWLSTRSRRRRVGLLLGRVDGIVTLWPQGRDRLVHMLGIVPEKVTVIPNGVPVDMFRGPEEAEWRAVRARWGLPFDRRVIAFVGSLSYEKGPDVAVEAMAHLPDCRLLVVGDGPMRRELEGRADQVAPGRVVFAGHIEDTLSAYWSADVLILPSETEGLSAVLIEAGLCQVPAVASAVGGTPDIVVDGVTGHTVDGRDPALFASAVQRCLAQRDDLGTAAARRSRDRYAMDGVVDAWVSLVAGMVTGRSVVPPGGGP